MADSVLATCCLPSRKAQRCASPNKAAFIKTKKGATNGHYYPQGQLDDLLSRLALKNQNSLLSGYCEAGAPKATWGGSTESLETLSSHMGWPCTPMVETASLVRF